MNTGERISEIEESIDSRVIVETTAQPTNQPHNQTFFFDGILLVFWSNEIILSPLEW